MIIIFIGPDRCGKTEIGQALAEKLGYQYYKSSYEAKYFNSKDSFRLLLKYHGPPFISFLEAVKIQGGLILDRFTPCEYVYAKTYNRETEDEIIWDIDEKLANMNAKIIYCHKSEYSNFDDEFVNIEDVDKIKTFYEEYLSRTKIEYLSIDTTDENLETQLNTILKFLN